MAVEALQKRRPRLPFIGPAQKIKHRMAIELASALIEKPRHRRRRLANEPHRPMDNGVFEVPLPGERRIITRRPHRASGDGEGKRRARGFDLAGPKVRGSIGGHRRRRSRAHALRAAKAGQEKGHDRSFELSQSSFVTPTARSRTAAGTTKSGKPNALSAFSLAASSSK